MGIGRDEEQAVMEGEPREVLAQEYRLEAAVRAAAQTLHESAREKHQFTWDASAPAWRTEMSAFVRPLVAAALAAADHFDETARSSLRGNSA